MQSTDIPVRFPEPFAKNATGSYKRAIPTTTGDPNAASLDIGFPPNTFVAQASGGVPPDGRDFNGLLNQVTAWCQWFSTGGPVFWDSTFSIAIGGYPKGAVVQALTQDKWWVSVAENNLTNPDTGGAGWISAPFILSNAYSVPINSAVAIPTSAANPLTIAASGSVFLATGTLGAASLYPLARVTTHYNPTLLASGFAAASGSSLIFKVGAVYVLTQGSGNDIFTATSLSGPWTQQGSVRATAAAQNGNGLVLVNGAVSKFTANGTAFSTGAPAAGNWTDAAASATTFVVIDGSSATGNTSYRTSTDGINWTTRTLPAFQYQSALTYGNGYFVYLTGNGADEDTPVACYTSVDGITWTSRGNVLLHADFDNGNAADLSIDYVNNRFFANVGSESNPNYLWTSTDAITWTAITGSAATSVQVGYKQNFAYVGGTYFHVGTFKTSADGLAWAYPAVQGWSVNPGGVSRVAAIDSKFVVFVGAALSVYDLQYSATGYVGLPYTLPAPVVPAPPLGPTDSQTMYVRVN